MIEEASHAPQTPAPLAVRLDFRQIARTYLPCGAKVPAFLIQYQTQANPDLGTISRDLLLGIDGIDLGRVEELARLLADLGVVLVPIPLAPQHNDFPPTNDVSHRTWAIPDEATILDRAREVCRRQVSGFVQIFSNEEHWDPVPWVPQASDDPLKEQILGCLSDVYATMSLGEVP